jgi:dihydroorotase-like cyclic amidohydrolase
MPSFLISNTRVFDGESLIHDHGYVLVEDDCIKLVSATKPAALPKDCTELDGSGCTVLPGLVDAHVHAYHDVDFLEKAIQYGVTTVIDMHNEPHWFTDLKEISTKRNDMSDIKSVCYGATIKNGWPAAIVTLSSTEPDVRCKELGRQLL